MCAGVPGLKTRRVPFLNITEGRWSMGMLEEWVSLDRQGGPEAMLHPPPSNPFSA